jgi:biopolymer transport protein ExbD
MKRFDGINVIPFIDVMLVLLAIVLTTATFIVEGRLDVELPEAEGEASAAAPEPFEITVDQAGRLFVAARPVSARVLAEQLDGLAPETPVNLRVDTAAEFGSFVAVVDLLKARDLSRVSITTRRP